jgi:DNA-binding NarL/FixJ family response regulator
MDALRILIADDHPVFRKGLRQIIEDEPGFAVVAEAEDGAAALALLRERRPDVAVLDIDMPRMDGFEVIRAVRSEGLQVALVILTMHKDEEFFSQALALDVRGYILKDSAVTDIVGSIRAAASGSYFITPSISNYLVNRNRRIAEFEKQNPGLRDLTPTERRVLKALAAYQTNKEIAATLAMSPRTVENHRANICQKLDLRGTHALLRFAQEHKNEIE